MVEMRVHDPERADLVRELVGSTLRPIVEDWFGEEVTADLLYGPRVYKEGSIFAPHVDFLPYVVGVIINVDQDLEEPWPFEVIGHDRKAHNVTLESKSSRTQTVQYNQFQSLGGAKS